MPGRLEGRVAIVCGAGSIGPGWGNGKATAVLYAREGARVFAVDVKSTAAEETCRLIREEGGLGYPCAADVSNGGEVDAMIRQCLAEFGRVDILHNNVGIVEVAGAIDATEESWDRVIAVNLKSVFLTCRGVLPHMVSQGGGAIVNISSIAAIRWTGIPYVSYSATKAAMIQFTRSVALEFAAKGVRANCILPGLMNTPMILEPLKEAYAEGDVAKMIEIRDRQCPMGHMGDAWDVAYAALFLASDEARYVTGTELVVDGGLSATCV